MKLTKRQQQEIKLALTSFGMMLEKVTPRQDAIEAIVLSAALMIDLVRGEEGEDKTKEMLISAQNLVSQLRLNADGIKAQIMKEGDK